MFDTYVLQKDLFPEEIKGEDFTYFKKNKDAIKRKRIEPFLNMRNEIFCTNNASIKIEFSLGVE